MQIHLYPWSQWSSCLRDDANIEKLSLYAHLLHATVLCQVQANRPIFSLGLAFPDRNTGAL
jgi:hypothetical protein